MVAASTLHDRSAAAARDDQGDDNNGNARPHVCMTIAGDRRFPAGASRADAAAPIGRYGEALAGNVAAKKSKMVLTQIAELLD